ncbi:hypothetical protein MTBBW1_1940028 [Desulfamplus magnetovallimortis]|uniref:PKD domain-containing protein n=1 Tax=Desulfamplus magnetovallimortis TaxID=1246637 RepID=A0A1W1HB25_9BACT|nr:PKD domain-containing protein [Desulfamplus magnetovallimortis]SLM29701.1 hypothetical protein MTBBW1_1940028 [Desulfamplus magnetovallimortis]
MNRMKIEQQGNTKIAFIIIILFCIYYNVCGAAEILYDDFSDVNFSNNGQWWIEEYGNKFDSWNTEIVNGRLRISATGDSDASYLRLRVPYEIKLKKSMRAKIRLISADSRAGIRLCGYLLNIRHSPENLYNSDGNVWVGVYVENTNGNFYRVAMVAEINNANGFAEKELIPWQTVVNNLQLNTDYEVSVSFDDTTRTITLGCNGILREYTFDESYDIYPLSSCQATGLRLDAYVRDNNEPKTLIAEIDDVWVSDYHDPVLEQCPEENESTNEPLVFSIAASEISDYAPFEISFSCAISSGTAPYEYEWDFGDGSVQEGDQETSHLYDTPGVYVVSCTVTDSTGQRDTESVSIEVQGAQSSSVKGKIVSTAGNEPIANATIKLFSGGEVVAEGLTSSSGYFDFDSLSTGVYSAEVSAPNYATTTVAPFNLVAGASPFLNVEISANAPEIREPVTVTPSLIVAGAGEKVTFLVSVYDPDGAGDIESVVLKHDLLNSIFGSDGVEMSLVETAFSENPYIANYQFKTSLFSGLSPQNYIVDVVARDISGFRLLILSNSV